MTDLQFLILALLAIYLSECFFWVPRGSVVLRCLFGRFAILHPSPLIGSYRAGIVLLNPLPPLGQAFPCHQWPLSLTPQGVYSFVPQVPHQHDRPEHLALYLPFADILSVSRDAATLNLNHRPFAHLPDESSAARFAGLIEQLRVLPPEQRSGAIDAALADSLRLRAIRQRLLLFRQLSGPLKIYSHCVLLLLFFALPAAIGSHLVRPYLLPILTLLLLALLTTVHSFYYAHKQLYPDTRGTRLRATLTMVFTPTAAIRASDVLSRELLSAFQPLAVAWVLCSPELFRPFVRHLLLDLEHPMQPVCPPTANDVQRQAVSAFHQRLHTALRDFLTRQQQDPTELTRPLAPEDPSCLTYCPRCEGQFLLPAGVCENCGGLTLLAFIPQPLSDGSRPSHR